jgi:hypothetical protein
MHEQMPFRHLELRDIIRETKECIPCIKATLDLYRRKGGSGMPPQQDELFEMSAGCQELCPDVTHLPDPVAKLKKQKQ